MANKAQNGKAEVQRLEGMALSAGQKSAYGINGELYGSAKRVPYNLLIIRAATLYLRLADKLKKTPGDLNSRTFAVKGYQDLPVPVELIEPAEERGDLPALIDIHGGAFSYPASPHHKELAYQYAREVPCRVLLPDYHLLPRYPYPAAFLDNLAVYKWVTAHAPQLRIEENHIIVAGDSAGAALAACVVNSYEKEGLTRPCGQVLIYPAADASLSTGSMEKYADTPLWNAVNNRKMWRYYLQGKSEQERKEASPLHHELPQGLPETYLETAEYDCLHDEGIAYANKIRAAGAGVLVNETKGTFHGYDSCLDAAITRANVKKRIAFMQDLLREK